MLALSGQRETTQKSPREIRAAPKQQQALGRRDVQAMMDTKALCAVLSHAHRRHKNTRRSQVQTGMSEPAPAPLLIEGI
ncbi:hypothetical protein LF63_0106760 [Oleiagrimonas soli]|uniref:Uncharacterized protein n=1 Tax=Oleiagrimonas soli TaxID=1543381 RepID=A0A099CYH8_9GAMM|nr:hypothetical protein LF63_0106760 [Oleiagrimonas soli]